MKSLSKFLYAGVSVVMAGASFAAPAQAAQIRMASEYSISFAGIPVARSKFKTLIDGNTLYVTGTLATAGIAAVFDSTHATSTSSGIISAKGVESLSYELDYKSGEKTRSTKVSFRGGKVMETTITPKREPNPNIVPIEPGQLSGVIDPFFASLVAANSPSDVCKRTLKVFDGVLRINLVMRPAGGEPYVIGKIKGEGVRCAVRYQPVSGHKPKSSSVMYMAEGERATIVFGALPGTNLYAPVKASVKTKNGTVTVRATKFEQSIE
jgi:Protein of unknown function (DUF3108)